MSLKEIAGIIIIAIILLSYLFVMIRLHVSVRRVVKDNEKLKKWVETHFPEEEK